MNKSALYLICTLGIVGAVLLIVYGAFLPFLKAQAYIDAVNRAGSTKTLQEFEQNFDKVYGFYSPVGDEETTKFLMSNIIQIAPTQAENVDRALAEYIEPHIISGDTRHLVSAANLRVIILTKFSKAEDYDKAIEYYQKARVIGPKLPPVLYGLLSLYNARGDVANEKEVAAEILKYWPQDTRVSELLKTLK